MKEPYVLGTDEDELDRLGIQHRVWAEETSRVWRDSGVRNGSTILDLGCGPGYTTFDLAQVVGASGKVVAADQSDKFLNYIRNQIRARGVENIDVHSVDAQSLDDFESWKGKMDFVYTRWLLCWLPDPEIAIRAAFESLKPGGKFIIHDYFNWGAMTIAPRNSAVTELVQAAIKSFEDRQGDIDVAAQIPKWLEEVGFKNFEMKIHQKVARGGGEDGTVDWILTWWRTYGPKLVESKHLKATVCEAALAELKKLEVDKRVFFPCPPVYEFVARKA
ncbi:MAG: methyltransferase domain-containing protein [Bdellovibrionales bacterium]|nr:methyltransferase domain-containing protein [Bdellovibrionales bacterium]